MQILQRFILVLLTCLPATPLVAQDQPQLPDTPKQYTRIISLYSAHTENLVSLGASQQLIGISVSDDYPKQILSKPRFSYREDPEKFIAARPDLVLIRPMIERSYPQLLDKLQRAGIDVISLQPTSVDEIFAYWRALGKLTGKSQAAEEMVTRFQHATKQISQQIAIIPAADRPTVYFESIHKKMKTFAPTSIAIYVLEQAGGTNAAADAFQVRKTNIAAYSKERILAKAEDINIFLAQRGRMNPIERSTILNESGFMAIKAVREGKVFLVDEQLVSRPTLRIIKGVERIRDILFPQQFNTMVQQQ